MVVSVENKVLNVFEVAQRCKKLEVLLSTSPVIISSKVFYRVAKLILLLLRNRRSKLSCFHDGTTTYFH